jgi:hypothetical protein
MMNFLELSMPRTGMDDVNEFVWYGFTYKSDMSSLFCIDSIYVSL